MVWPPESFFSSERIITMIARRSSTETGLSVVRQSPSNGERPACQRWFISAPTRVSSGLTAKNKLPGPKKQLTESRFENHLEPRNVAPVSFIFLLGFLLLVRRLPKPHPDSLPQTDIRHL